MKQDLREKRAQFVQRNNEICQEFSFAHPCTKTQLNAIYNCHFTGSPLWDLFSRESEMLESTWNIAIRKMFKLNRTTHRYFIEPISEMKHVKWSLTKRFINFIQKIQLSSKSQLKNLLMVSRKDCRSTTGRNIRHITKLFDGKPIETIKNEDLKKLKYHEATKDDEWRLGLVKEITDVLYGQQKLQGFDREMLNEILVSTCTT